MSRRIRAYMIEIKSVKPSILINPYGEFFKTSGYTVHIQLSCLAYGAFAFRVSDYWITLSAQCPNIIHSIPGLGDIVKFNDTF